MGRCDRPNCKKCENAENGTAKTDKTQTGRGFVGFVSLSSGQIRENFAPDANDLWVQYEERAAILEYDGGHCRAMLNGWRGRKCSAATPFPMTRSTP